MAVQNNTNIFGGLLLASSVTTVLLLQMFDSSNTGISLSILTMLLCGFIAYWRIRQYGIDPLGLFCAAFALYDGLLLFRLATIEDDSTLPYPTTFGSETYQAAGTLCVIAAITMFFSAIAWEAIIEPRLGPPKPVNAKAGDRWFWAGVITYGIGVALYFVQFQQFGGYFSALAMQRGDRFELAGDPNLLSYPYLAFVVPGIASMCYGAEVMKIRQKRTMCYVLLGIWCVLVLLQGDRRLVLQCLMTVAGVLGVLKPQALRLKFRTWVLIILSYCLFSIFGYSRFLITEVASGNSSVNEAFNHVGDEWSMDWMLPEHTELAGPYFSLLSSVSEHTDQLHGSSYYQSFLAVLPRFLYPGEKPELLTHRFDTKVHRGGGVVAGWGYNPVAEAYVNFGVLGVVLVFVLWSIFFLIAGRLRYQSAFGTIVAAVLISETINANRIDFRNVYGESIYFLGGAVFAAFIVAIWGGSRPRSIQIQLPQTLSSQGWQMPDPQSDPVS